MLKHIGCNGLISMKNLIVIPTKFEIECFLDGCNDLGLNQKKSVLGRYDVIEFPEINTGVTRGGLGKVQFGVQTQYLIHQADNPDAVLCVGAAGALSEELSLGDIVIATETVEHDIKNKLGRPLIPRFQSNEIIVTEFKKMAEKKRSFRLHFGAVASGDEDIMDDTRKEELRSMTDALAVAWEGAGGARACRVSDVPFVEVRGITDFANPGAGDDFFKNLEKVMKNLAEVVTEWALHR
jgi:adenosylhomocysteine nucleosidase